MATKSIKGITIEIAGDTVKLGKALKGVDEQSKDLTASLKYVDKLLDFDPGNTELLEEKQKLLTEAVDNTCEKLETLKDVQDQIKRQYASGEIGQRAYLDFRAELVKTEQQLNDLYAESDRVSDSLNKTGSEARSTADDFDKLADGVNDSAGELGSLDDALDGLITGGKIAAVAGAIGGVASKVGEVEEETREYREEMAKLDVSFESANLNADDAQAAYSSLYRVLGETDQAVEASQQIALLADSTADVARWAAVSPGLVARFGDALQPETFYESANETLKLSEATGAFVQLLEGTGVISVDAFNKRLQSLNSEEAKQQYMLGVAERLLGDAAEAYEERNAAVLEARDADARLTAAEAELGEAFAPVVTGFKNMKAAALEGVVPAVEDVISVFGDAGDAISFAFSEATMSAEDFAAACDAIATAWNDSTNWISDQAVTMGGAFSDSIAIWNATDDAIAGFWDSVVKESDSGADDAIAATDRINRDGLSALVGHFATQGEKLARSWADTATKIKNTDWTVPKPKIPEFSISGKFALQPPQAPKISVTWNAKGGILTEPTIFGALGGNLLGGGEAGQEAVLPLSSFYEHLEQILARNSGGKQILVESPQFVVHAQTDQDLDSLAAQMADSFTAELGRRLHEL